MKRYTRNPAVGETGIEAEVFLVTPGDGEVFYLDEVTSGLWRILAEPVTADEISAAYRAAFPEVEAARIAGDVMQALADLEKRGLVIVTTD